MSTIYFAPTPNLPIIKYQTNFSDKYIKQIKRKSNFENFSVIFQSPTFDNEILFRQIKNKKIDTPFIPFFVEFELSLQKFSFSVGSFGNVY